MNYTKLVLVAAFVVMTSGCATIDCIPDKLRTGYALPGTNTVVVGISLNKDGVPQESYKDIILHPGQTVLFAGPDKFSIVFKNRKTPNGKIENQSVNGAVSIKIPEDILRKSEFVEEYRQNKEVVFDYAISVNGKELDPPMRIKDEN
jgi:hypothetical protein